MLRPISISPVLNGFIVQIGCQSLAYTSREKLSSDLASYLDDPEATEKRILKNEGINRKHTLGEPFPVGMMPSAAPAPASMPTAAGRCDILWDRGSTANEASGDPQATRGQVVGHDQLR